MSVSNLGDLVATATLDISPFASNTAQLKMLVRGLDNQLKLVENSFKGQRDKLSGLKASHLQLGKLLEGNQALFANQARRYQNLKMVSIPYRVHVINVVIFVISYVISKWYVSIPYRVHVMQLIAANDAGFMFQFLIGFM